jgi:uncharacterized damage-inducible protein DinB
MAVRKPLDLERELLEAFEHSGRVTEHLVRVLPSGVWRAPPPAGRGRTIAAIVAHMQGVRRTFAKMGGVAVVPPALHRATSTQAQALRAIQHSNEALAQVFGGALSRGDGRIRGLPRRVVNMMLYIVQHDAHHRGQICSLARAHGHEFTRDDMMRLWGWKKLPSSR